MKKTNLLLSAAIAGLFATSAHAGMDKKMPVNEKDCMKQKMMWKDGSCMKDDDAGQAMKAKGSDKDGNSCGANGCNGKTSDKK